VRVERRRLEDGGDAGALQLEAVADGVARVHVKVLVRGELRRVDVDAGDDDVGGGGGGGDEREVTLVQVALFFLGRACWWML
jgi:hypothetical protein